MSEEAYAVLFGGGIPAVVLLTGSVIRLRGDKTVWPVLQLIGAACLVVVALAHVFEALHLFPWMLWGHPRSAGHYVDLGAVVLGVTLFPVGYLLDAIRNRSVSTLRQVGSHEC